MALFCGLFHSQEKRRLDTHRGAPRLAFASIGVGSLGFMSLGLCV